MATFTKYWPTPEALAFSERFPSTYRATFIGWDARTQGTEATEATEARDLGVRMSATDEARFAMLNPGERVAKDGIVYAYD